MRWSIPTILALAMLAGACNERHETDIDDAGFDAGAEIPPFEPYHLEDTEVAVSLGLDRAGGTFRHHINLCSIIASGDGQLTEMGAMTILTPNPGSDGFIWYSATSSDRMVTEVRLRPDPLGLIAAFEADGEAIEEVWLDGGICPDCEPTGGGTFPCENPFGG